LSERDVSRNSKGHLNTEHHSNLTEYAITLKDPVHHDIFLTRLEETLIDTPQFQRLRSIRQLGLTNLLYVGAEHTIFAHSLGTLQITQNMIDVLNRNSLNQSSSLDRRVTALARISALLHDIASLPFGTSLDSNSIGLPASIYRKQIEKIFSPASEIGLILSKAFDTSFLNDVCQIVGATSANDYNNLKFPWIAEMIKRGMCAEFIDSTLRDSFFCGILPSIDIRFIQSVAIREDGSDRKRLVYDFTQKID
jgi:uncharacterized protein